MAVVTSSCPRSLYSILYEEKLKRWPCPSCGCYERKQAASMKVGFVSIPLSGHLHHHDSTRTQTTITRQRSPIFRRSRRRTIRSRVSSSDQISRLIYVNSQRFQPLPRLHLAMVTSVSALRSGEPTRLEAGCLNYDLHRSIDDADVWFVYENWRSSEGFDAHMLSEHLISHPSKYRPYQKERGTKQ